MTCKRFLEDHSFLYLLTYKHANYSPVWLLRFRLVKRIGQYFTKELSEQKVPVTDVAGLYSTYQKYIMIGAPNSYQFREKWT